MVKKLAALVPLLLGCSGDPIAVPPSSEPFVYLVLNETTVSDLTRERGQYALLATTGAPAGPMTYRSAERFTLRRAADGRMFGFVEHDVHGQIIEPQIERGNYRLSCTGDCSEEIVTGGTYTLDLRTGGVEINGETTVPAEFTFTAVEEDGRRAVAWEPVPDAAAYIVTAWPEPGEIILDTLFHLPPETPSLDEVSVTAIDSNLYAYLVDEGRARAGITAGYGVFGAATRGRPEGE